MIGEVAAPLNRDGLEFVGRSLFQPATASTHDSNGRTSGFPFFKEFFTTCPLAIVTVANLDPLGMVGQVRTEFVPRYNPFQISLTYKFEQTLALMLNVIAVQ